MLEHTLSFPIVCNVFTYCVRLMGAGSRWLGGAELCMHLSGLSSPTAAAAAAWSCLRRSACCGAPQYGVRFMLQEVHQTYGTCEPRQGEVQIGLAAPVAPGADPTRVP